MNIRLTPEQERIIQDELESGHFRTAEWRHNHSS